MSAPITQFVDITINLTGAVAEKFGFGTPAGVFAHNLSPDRLVGPFIDIAGVNDAGFTSSAAPEINAWARSVFGQDNGVDQLVIGRRLVASQTAALQVWQFETPSTFVDETVPFNDATDADWDVLPAADAAGNYAAIGMAAPFGGLTLDNLNGTAGVAGAVAWEYWNGSAWAALTGVTDGTSGFTVAVSDGQTVTWTVPTDWADVALNGETTARFYVRAVSDGNYSTLPVYDQGFVDFIAADASWTATMDALEAFEQLNTTKSFYGINVETRVKADILEVAAWTQPRFKIFGCQSADADILTGAASNLFETLAAFGYTRTWGIYHATSTGADGYLDGAWMSKGLGFNLDVPGGVGVWGLKMLQGVTGDRINPTQVEAVYANLGNVYTDAGKIAFTSNGNMFAGTVTAPHFIDITTTIDWIEARSQEAILSLLVGTPTKIPYTDGGINQVVSAWQGVLDAAVNFKHLSPDDPPRIKAPLISEVSAADKQSRTLTLTAEATLAGAIQKVVLVLNLSF